MRQFSAFMVKELKEFVRAPSAMFWAIAWPAFWLLLAIFVFLAGIPEEVLSRARGSATIQMVAFGIGSVGIVGVSIGVATDRDRGLYEKLLSMPVSFWSEAMGRLIGSLIISAMNAAILICIGLLLGSEFEATAIDVAKSIPFFATLILSSTGLGLIIANSLRRVQAVNGTAISALVLGSAISGVFTPYPFLPEELRAFSRVYPISASMHAIKYFLLPSEFKFMPYDFNPGNPGFIAYTLASSLMLLAIGVAFHKFTSRLRARRI